MILKGMVMDGAHAVLRRSIHPYLARGVELVGRLEDGTRINQTYDCRPPCSELHPVRTHMDPAFTTR